MKRNRKNEKGVALLFTLGMLALLLVMAMAFASMARIGRKAASNNADLTTTRALAQSAIQRAMGAMRLYRESGGSQYDNIISHDTTSTNQKSYDLLNHLETIIDTDVIYRWPIPYNPDAADAIHWQYIDNGRTGTDLRLIGRIAYVAYGSGGKLDPSSCVRHTAATLGVPAGTAVNENGAAEVRNGNYSNEINIQNLNRADVTNLPATDVAKFSSDEVSGGLLVDGTRWSDWGTMFSLLGVATAPKKEKWRTWFDIERPADAESFWVDSDGDGVETPSELYHRFNVGNRTTTGQTWNDLTVANIISDAAEYNNSTSTHEGTGILFLKNYSALPIDNFPSAAVRANQIAANLIDYCDTNRTATTDNVNAPTYTGNDQTPYINEIRLTVDGDIIEAPVGTYNCGVVMTADVEVVNIYYTTDNQSFNLVADVTVSGSYGWGPKNVTKTFTDVPITVNINSVGDRSYVTGTSASEDISDGTWSGAPGQAKRIDNFQFTKINVKLTKSGTGEFYDYSFVETASGTYDIKTNSADNDRLFYFDYEINDPRNNLHEANWTLSPSKKNANGTTGAGGVGVKNSACNPNPGGNKDVETGAVNPWDVSTAYIRNSYMRSLWEIGFIHRGAAWETLRIYLYNYTTAMGVGPTDGITTWLLGDAGILNQIKMSNEVESFGKINVNASNGEVLKALIGAIRIGVSPNPNSATVLPYPRLPNASRTTADGTDDSNPGALSYGSELDYATDVTNMAQNATLSILNPPSPATYKPYRTRAQVVRGPLLTSRLTSGVECTQTTDALKEEVIGKFINLTKASPDTITIIAIAQTIKDVGGGITINNDLDDNGAIGGTVTESGYDIDGKDLNGDGDYTNDTLPSDCEIISNCTFGTYDQYADKILAEQKIKAIIIYDQTTQRWRILRYEYIE